MGVGEGAGLYMCDLVKKFTFAISSPDEFLCYLQLTLLLLDLTLNLTVSGVKLRTVMGP